MAEPMHQKRRAWIGPAIGIGILLMMAFAWLLAILPRTIRINGRSKEFEAKYNLKAAFVAEKAHYAETDRYEESVEAIGFWPESGNRYRLFFSKVGDAKRAYDAADGGPHTGILTDKVKFPSANDAVLAAAIPPALLSTVGLEGTCPDCNITIVAAGNIDDDPTIDVWSISTKERTISDERVPAGVPFRHVNDSEY